MSKFFFGFVYKIALPYLYEILLIFAVFTLEEMFNKKKRGKKFYCSVSIFCPSLILTNSYFIVHLEQWIRDEGQNFVHDSTF